MNAPRSHVRPTKGSFVFLCLLSILVFGGGFILALQRQQSNALRAELALAHDGTTELKRLKLENERLRSQQIPPAQLDALRADHAAVARLRAELESLRK